MESAFERNGAHVEQHEASTTYNKVMQTNQKMDIEIVVISSKFAL